MQSIHDIRLLSNMSRNLMDTELRIYIGKTDDEDISLCMHSATVAREMAQKCIIVCRVCNKGLPEGIGRYNDHKIIRHQNCVQPICSSCAEDRPDIWYREFSRGVQERKEAKQRLQDII